MVDIKDGRVDPFILFNLIFSEREDIISFESTEETFDQLCKVRKMLIQ